MAQYMMLHICTATALQRVCRKRYGTSESVAKYTLRCCTLDCCNQPINVGQLLLTLAFNDYADAVDCKVSMHACWPYGQLVPLDTNVSFTSFYFLNKASLHDQQ